jgi:hypothetical protein
MPRYIETFGKQIDIQYPAYRKYVITSFHYIVWMFIAVSVTIYRNAAAPPERHQSSSGNCIIATKLRSCV